MLYCQLNTVILSSKRSDIYAYAFNIVLHSLFLIFSQRKSRGPFKWWISTTYQSRRTGTPSSARAVAEADSRQGTGDLHVQRPSYIQRTHKFVFYASRKRNLKGSSFFFSFICTLLRSNHSTSVILSSNMTLRFLLLIRLKEIKMSFLCRPWSICFFPPWDGRLSTSSCNAEWVHGRVAEFNRARWLAFLLSKENKYK